MATEITATPATDTEQGEPATGRVGDTASASWSVSLEDLRSNISHAPESTQELIVWCYLYCTDAQHPMRREEFAARVGYDHTTILKILRGSYLHPETRERQAIPDKLVRAMSMFRDLETERNLSKRAPFVRTPTLERIWTACDLARESQSPVFLIGPSHIGKSVALVTYKDDHNHGRTIYVRLQAASGLGGMVKAIAQSIGGIGLKANTATLIESIKRKLKPNMLLILDEVHELIYTYRRESFFACLEVIREIYDSTQCGLVLCGTTLLMKEIQHNRGELEQLLRRGVHKVVLPSQPTRADLTAILESVGLDFPDKKLMVKVTVGGQSLVEEPYEMLRQVGADEGLKAITERLRYGQKFARKSKMALAWDHVVKAHLTIKQNELPGDDWN